jgi:hypothetical protein
MRTTIMLLSCVLVLGTATTAVSGELPMVREKAATAGAPVQPSGDRVGGDTAADAVPITVLPFSDTGSTCGAADDYDDACTQAAAAPDVVYSFTPAMDVFVDVDLCGSAYDTKIFVLDRELNPIACADDTYWQTEGDCAIWTAKLEWLQLLGGELYYIVVDGWGADCGEYALSVTEAEYCDIPCPAGAYVENEPPMEGQYDQFNAGCFSDWTDPLPYIIPVPYPEFTRICGDNGYYDIPDGMGYDHDWWTIVVGEAGVVEVTIQARRSTWLAEVPIPEGDCDLAYIAQEATCRPCTPAVLVMTGEPGEVKVFWVHTHYNEYPNGAYPYYLEVDGGTVAARPMSWSGVKALYR